MKKAFYLILVILVISITARSQGNNPPPGGGTGNIFKPDNSRFAKMGEIIPPAPDATAIARFGGVNIDLNTGSVNKSIELKAITNKSLSVPISLFFKSNGISVNQFPSRVGMGWAISAGGQISRVIHGQDDLLKQRYVPNFTVTPNEEDPNLTTYCWHLMTDGDKDSEPDVFSFSFGGYSGKFLFDNDGVITQLPASNLKIEYNPSPSSNYIWTFRITTPDGVQYYFGGSGATESTKYAASSQGGAYNPNAWCLNKIVHPNGYFITFTYETQNDLIDNYMVGITQTHYKNPVDAAIPLTYNGEEVDGVIYPIYESQAYMSAKVRLLKEITTSYGAKVTFDYSTTLYPEKVITGINYFNENNKRVSRYVLSYTEAQTTMGINGMTGKVPFINKITELDEQNNLLNLGHTFEYYGLNNIPTRVASYSQDHWGFFNGKNNYTLIAQPEDEELAYQFPSSTANRNPDPVYAVNGLIKKITYPTGGKDEIEYEANTIQEMQDQNPYAQVYQTIIGTTFNQYVESAGILFDVTYENKIKAWFQCQYVGAGSWEGDFHDKGRIRIVNTANNQEVYLRYIDVNANLVTEFPVLPTGTYRLYIASSGINIRTDGNVKFRTGSAPNMQNVSVAVGGLRVKKTTTSDNIVNAPIVKRYYYGTLNNLNYSSASIVQKPKYLVQFNFTVGFLWGQCNALIKTYSPHKALHCNSINKLYLTDGKIQEYTSVIESVGGENFENGAIEHKFHVINDIEAQPIRGWYNLDASPTNSYYLSKGEIETNVYAKKAGILVPVTSVQNEITIDTRNFKEIAIYNVHQKGPLACTQMNGSTIIGPAPLHHMIFDVHRYYLTSAWKYLSKKTEKKYDENGLNPLTQVTDYYYDDDRNFMLSRTEVLNSKGELMKQQNKYPHDFSSMGNVYEAMVNKNIISPNVETSVFKNGQQLFNTKSNYSNTWFSDNHLIAINTVEEQKAGYPSETRFRYYSYDTDGNPAELSKEGDAHQTVIWDYKSNFPVAKIINANLGDVAYTSFEADGKGNWIFTATPVTDNSSPTGKKSYILNGTNDITKSGLNSSMTYVISYWTKNSNAFTITGTQSGYPIAGRQLNGWTYFEHKITGQTSITISGNGSIDEVRLYPEKALMTTYTYEPMIGMTGQCDVNNKTTYYEYDGFNRLAIVRDQDRNILKKICYNYAGMIEDCTSPCLNPTPANWQNTTTPPTCQQGPCGNTGYQLQEQRDINTCSLTYNQLQVVPVYNPTACPLSACVNLTSTNVLALSGYTASYNDGAGHIFTFPVPATTGLQSLGAIPAGNYTLTISRTTGTPLFATFKSGCFKQTMDGTMAIFSNVAVSSTTCNSITIDVSSAY